jgi:hypothetical protein
MITRRAMLMGTIGGFAGAGLLSRVSQAFVIEEMPPHVSNALAAACRPAADNNHAALLKSARDDLLARIAKGVLPAGATEQVGCPVCGCNFVVSADGAL